MTNITHIGTAQKGKRRANQAEREARLLEEIDQLVQAFWEEGVRLSEVTITWTDDEDYVREARGEQL